MRTTAIRGNHPARSSVGSGTGETTRATTSSASVTAPAAQCTPDRAVNQKAAAVELDPEQKRRLERENRARSEEALTRYNDAARKVRHLPGAEKILVSFLKQATGAGR